MNSYRFGVVLTVLNLFLLAFLLAQANRPLLADETPAILRARGLEIVDPQGRVRASISVFPEETAADGTRSAETVLLRLITERGRPIVKVSAGEDGSGVSIAGPTGTHQTYLSMGARANSTTLTLKNEDGRERTVAP
jgi:hypothetical protein